MQDRFYIKVVCRQCGESGIKSVEAYVEGDDHQGLSDAVDKVLKSRMIPLHACNDKVLGTFSIIAAARHPDSLS